MNAKWKGLTIRDKVEGERVIPLTPYVAQLLAVLPRVNAWVFASPSHDEDMQDKAMSTPHKHHERACAVAGLEGLTLHGLRRSFKSLTEWVEIPVGVVAQIMGHKPSATAEKHYTVRPLDLLRLHHEKIEAWILEQAGVPMNAMSALPCGRCLARLRSCRFASSHDACTATPASSWTPTAIACPGASLARASRPS